MKQIVGVLGYVIIGGGWCVAVLWMAARYVPGPSKKPTSVPVVPPVA